MNTQPLIDRLLQTCDVLQEVSNLAAALPEHRQDAAAMSLHMQLTRTYLAELALNLQQGREPYDAVLTTARGMTPIG
jgi:hypothetical protein